VTGEAHSDAWVSTGTGILPRGLPYQKRNRTQRVGINHGLWTNVADYDAVTQLVIGRTGGAFEPVQQTIPRGSYYPMCGMNLAWRAELTPAMYFLLMGRDWPFDRFGDIWCGLLSKKICDHLGYAVMSGDPMIEHRRASNVWTNLQKEAPGLPVNETLWSAIDSIVLTESNVAACYAQIARELSIAGDYWDRLREAMGFWSEITASAIESHKTDRARTILRSERCRIQPPEPQRLPA
jgi:reversibly glycosylated polypeptide / UDP-arabinopyranose mutase